MTLMTRAVAAFTVLSVAAIPVAALTIKNTASQDVKIGVDTGSAEAVYTVPANGSVDVKEDCSSDCGVTGPWGYSRLVNQNATIETDGTSLVTANAASPSAALVPQNPISDSVTGSAAEAAPVAAEPAPVATPRKRAQNRPGKQAKKGPAPGSFGVLLTPPSKK